MGGKFDGAKVLEWRRRFERFRVSEATIATFCQRENVSIASFYYWRRALGAVPKSRVGSPDRQRDFAPIRLVSSATVSVHLPGGTRLEIPLGDSAVFERTLETLLRADAQRAETRQGGGTC
jgi:hypothetical protein